MNRYLYEQIYEELKAEILSGTYRRGDWFPPERVLKERFATTHLTVRNALAKLVLEGYIERYSGKGTIVLYSRGASSGQRRLRFPWACLIVADLGEANAALAEFLEAGMRTLPLALRVSCHHGDLLLSQALQRETAESGGLVILDPVGNSPVLKAQDTFTGGMILLRDEGQDIPCPVVTRDLVHAGRLAATYLTDGGHRRVAFLPGAERSPDLLSGLSKELTRRGVSPQDIVSLRHTSSLEAAVAAVEKAISPEPACSAYVCASDEAAAGALSALRAAGLTPGKECAIVGLGNTRLARSLNITSIDTGADRIADRVIAVIRDAMTYGALDPQRFAVRPELVVRGT
jgi:DNA-binding LacI/PurR family transcriptional regulator